MLALAALLGCDDREPVAVRSSEVAEKEDVGRLLGAVGPSKAPNKRRTAAPPHGAIGAFHVQPNTEMSALAPAISLVSSSGETSVRIDIESETQLFLAVDGGERAGSENVVELTSTVQRTEIPISAPEYPETASFLLPERYELTIYPGTDAFDAPLDSLEFFVLWHDEPVLLDSASYVEHLTAREDLPLDEIAQALEAHGPGDGTPSRLMGAYEHRGAL